MVMKMVMKNMNQQSVRMKIIERRNHSVESKMRLYKMMMEVLARVREKEWRIAQAISLYISRNLVRMWSVS